MAVEVDGVGQPVRDSHRREMFAADVARARDLGGVGGRPAARPGRQANLLRRPPVRPDTRGQLQLGSYARPGLGERGANGRRDHPCVGPEPGHEHVPVAPHEVERRDALRGGLAPELPLPVDRDVVGHPVLDHPALAVRGVPAGVNPQDSQPLPPVLLVQLHELRHQPGRGALARSEVVHQDHVPLERLPVQRVAVDPALERAEARVEPPLHGVPRLGRGAGVPNAPGRRVVLGRAGGEGEDEGQECHGTHPTFDREGGPSYPEPQDPC